MVCQYHRRSYKLGDKLMRYLLKTGLILLVMGMTLISISRTGFCEWVTTDNGVKVWQDFMRYGIKTISWTGQVDGDGFATGNGTLIRINKDDSSFKYIGGMLKGKYNGFGSSVIPNGSRYDGDFVEGIFQGKGIMRTPGGIIVGDFKNGQPDGKLIARLSDGYVYIGDAVAGTYYGEGIKKWPNGSFYDGEFVKDILQGRGIFFDNSNGLALKGTFNNNQFVFNKDNVIREGEITDRNLSEGVIISKGGLVFLGDFVRANYSGHGIKRWQNGTIYKGEFTSGQPSGIGVMIMPDNTIYQGQFVAGKISTGIVILPNNTIREGNFVTSEYIEKK